MTDSFIQNKIRERIIEWAVDMSIGEKNKKNSKETITKALDLLTAQIIKNTCDEIERRMKELEKQNHDAKCQWSFPREMYSNNYNCTDMHTGYSEALSDIREDILTSITNTTGV